MPSRCRASIPTPSRSRTDEAAVAEQRSTIDILLKSNLPGRWAVKDSFNTLDLSRRGFDVLFDAHGSATSCPSTASSDIVWQRETAGKAPLPFDDPNFAMFVGRRGFGVVAGGMLYRAEGVVGLSNVVADAADAVAVWRSLGAAGRHGLSRACRWSATNPGDELKAARRCRLRDRRSAADLGQGAGLKPQAFNASIMCGGGGAITAIGGLFLDSGSTMPRECRCRSLSGSARP